MKSEIKNNILKQLCSNSLYNKIIETNWEIDDFLLVYLVYNSKVGYIKQIELLNLIIDHTLNEKAKIKAKRVKDYFNKAYQKIIATQKDCFFDIEIEEYEGDLKERYAVKIFDDVITKVKSMRNYYDFVNLTENSRIEVFKRELNDCFENSFAEDVVGDIVMDGNFKVLSFWFKDFDEISYLNENNCEKLDCDECKAECFTGLIVNDFPKFFDNLDLVTTKDFYGKILYGIVLTNDKNLNEIDDDSVYFIMLDEKTKVKQFKSKDDLWDFIFNYHNHINYVELEVVKKFTQVPKKIMKIYEKIIIQCKLYEIKL